MFVRVKSQITSHRSYKFLDYLLFGKRLDIKGKIPHPPDVQVKNVNVYITNVTI